MGHPVQQPQHGYLCWIPTRLEGGRTRGWVWRLNCCPAHLFAPHSSAIVGKRFACKHVFQPGALLCWECFERHWFSLLRSSLLSSLCYLGGNITKRKFFNHLSFHIKKKEHHRKSLWLSRLSPGWIFGREIFFLPLSRVAFPGQEFGSVRMSAGVLAGHEEKVYPALSVSSWLLSGTWFSGHVGSRQGVGYICSLADSLWCWARSFPCGWSAPWTSCTGVCGEMSLHRWATPHLLLLIAVVLCHPLPTGCCGPHQSV